MHCRPSPLLLVTVTLAVGFPLRAQAVQMLKDINTVFANRTAGSNPTSARRTTVPTSDRSLLKNGPIVYFSATTQQQGTELYRSLGTAPTTALLTDIFPGVGSSHPSSLTLVGSKLYFSADDGQVGQELWVFDSGSASRIRDIWPGPNGSRPSDIVALGSKVIFAATDLTSGTELWMSDGTTAGTMLLKDIQPGPGGSAPRYMTADAGGNYVVFAAAVSGTNHELWITDGSPAGTTLLREIRAGTTGSNPNYLQPLGTKIVFQANDGNSGNELWITDGTPSGTNLVQDIRAGTASGANLVYSVVVGNRLFFQGNDGATGAEPWVTDGTMPGTQLVRDIWTGTGTGGFYYPTTKGGKAYFGARSSSAGFEIWESDGTLAGTTAVSGSVGTSVPQHLAFASNNLFFSARNPSAGVELWVSDLTPAGTQVVKDINPTTASSSPQLMTEAIPGVVVFAADDGTHGREVWISDGTAAGTTLVDLNVPTLSPTNASSPNNMAHLFGTLLFSANDGTNGIELWSSDGTAAGTRLLKDIRAGSGSSSPFYLARLDNKVYFRANDGGSGNELWETDGTTAGTRLFMDIRPGTASSSPTWLVRIGSRIYFSANDGTNGIELWTTDGTTSGTLMLKDLNTSRQGASSAPQQFAALGDTGKFCFRANDGVNGVELWVSDGTASGTMLVKDIRPGSTSSSPNGLTWFRNAVYFSANDGTTGIELWKTDGTAAATMLVKNIYPGPASGTPNNSSPSYFAALGDKLFFAANDGVNGTEPWMTDGTTNGTTLFLDIDPVLNTGGGKDDIANRAGGATSYLTRVGSRHIWFAASRYPSGVEIWRTDGTVSGTVQVADILTGDDSSLPQNRGEHYAPNFAVVGSRVYFSADDGIHGREVWYAENGATASPVGNACGASWMNATDPVLGQRMQILGTTTLNNPVHAVLLGLAKRPPLALGGHCYSYVDLSAFLLVGVTVRGSWGLGLTLANETSLIGASALLQTWTLPNAALPGAVQTNGVQLVLGR